MRQKLLGHGESIARQSILRGEQPAAETLIETMVPVAHRRLRDQPHERIGVLHQHLLQFRRMEEFPLERALVDAQRLPALQYDGAIGRRAIVEHRAESDHALATDDRDLGGEAVLQNMVQGDDGRRRKIGMGDLATDVGQHVSGRQVDAIESSGQATPRLFRQIAEQSIAREFFRRVHGFLRNF